MLWYVHFLFINRSYLFHLLDFVLKFTGLTHHLPLLLQLLLFLEVLIQVLRNSVWILLCVDITNYWPENLLFTDYTVSEGVVLILTFGDVLAWVLGLVGQVLAIHQVTANFTAYHHAQFIYPQLGRGAIVTPIVVVSSAYWIVLIGMLVLNLLVPHNVLCDLPNGIASMHPILAFFPLFPIFFCHILDSI